MPHRPGGGGFASPPGHPACGSAVAPGHGEQAVAATLLKRWGSPEDVADAVVFLASTPYMSGQVLPVEGGRSVNG